MLKQERQATILEAVGTHHFVSIHDLMALTASSESTLRGDLNELAEQGKLIRLRGGAQAVNDRSLSYELTLETKMGIESEAKRKIGVYAASLIHPGSVVYLDAGTTTLAVAKAVEAKGAKFVTNSVSVARKLKSRGYQTFITGGEFKLTTDAFIGALTQETLVRFHFDMGFFGCNGVDLAQGITTPDFEEASVKQLAMAQCGQAYVLADHTKFGVVTAVSFHPFIGEEIITDAIIKADYRGLGIIEVK